MEREGINRETGGVVTVDVQPAIVPLQERMTPMDLIKAMQVYQEFQAALDKALAQSIVQIGRSKHRTNAYWRAIAKAYNISTRVLSIEEKEYDGDPTFVVQVEAMLPNGHATVGLGACAMSEKKAEQLRTIHNVQAHAETRAENRAICKLVGFSDVDAGELSDGGEFREDSPEKKHETPSGPSSSSSSSSVANGTITARMLSSLRKQLDDLDDLVDEAVAQGRMTRITPAEPDLLVHFGLNCLEQITLELRPKVKDWMSNRRDWVDAQNAGSDG